MHLRSFCTVAQVLALCLVQPHDASAALRAPAAAAGESYSLTRFVLVTNVFATSSGSFPYLSPLADIEGIVHTNGELRFAGNPVFTDTVSSSSGRAWFFNTGAPVELAADHNGSTDVPSFPRGFLRSAPYVLLPTDAYGQQAVALGFWAIPTPLTAVEINVALGLTGSAPPPNGLYFPHNGSLLTGGFYVQGDLSQCRLWSDTLGNKQWLRMVQGSTIRTVVVDGASNSTRVWYSSSTTGTPALVFLNQPPTFVIYVSGGILDLGGPNRVSSLAPPAVAKHTQLHFVSLGDIVVRRDLTCDSPDTSDNVLGLFTPGGAIRIGTDAPDNLRLDAFVLAPSAVNGEFTVDSWDSGVPRGTLHVRGGVAENFFGPVCTFDGSGALQSGYAREFRHDDRGLAPPCYPIVGPALVGVNSAPEPPPSLRFRSLSPNPSSGPIRIRYVLPRDEVVRLQVIDILGRRVATLVDGRQCAGDHEALWRGASARSVRPGIYLLRIEAGGESAVRRVVRLE